MSRLALRISLATTTLAILSGCATQPPPPPLDISKVKTLGVYSMCAIGLRREAYAYFDLGQDVPETKILPPNLLDGLIVKVIRDTAPKTMETREIPLDFRLVTKAVLADQADEDRLWRELLSGAPPQDLYLVLSPKYIGTHWIGRRNVISRDDLNKRMFGFGLTSRGLFDTAHAACGAFLYDPKRGEVVRRYSVEKTEPTPDGLSKDHWSDYSNEEFLRVVRVMGNLAFDIGELTVKQITTDPNNTLHPGL